MAAESVLSGTAHGLVSGGLLEAFTEDHLAVQSAVDLVVDVLDTGAAQITADLPAIQGGIDLDGR